MTGAGGTEAPGAGRGALALRSFVLDATPEYPVPLGGYARRRGLSDGVRSRLEVNGLILEQGAKRYALIAVDALFSGALFERAVREALKRRGPEAVPDDLLFIASHTHWAPMLDDTKPILGKVDEGYVRALAVRVAGAVADCLAASPRPLAGLRRGVEDCAGAVYRRRAVWQLTRRPPFLAKKCTLLPNHAEAHPRALQLVELTGEDGRAQAVLWSWPCHPLTTPRPMSVSADFPGAVRDAVRAHRGRPNLPVLFFPGFCGDLRPDFTIRRPRLSTLWRLPLTLGLIESFRRPSEAASEAFARRLSETATGLDLRDVAGGGRELVWRRADLALNRLLSGAPEGATTLTRLSLAGVEMLFAGAEVCSRYRAVLGGIVPPETLMSGYAGPVFGYLPTEAQRVEGGYEVEGFRRGFNVSGHFLPECEGAVAEAVARLFAEGADAARP